MSLGGNIGVGLRYRKLYEHIGMLHTPNMSTIQNLKHLLNEHKDKTLPSMAMSSIWNGNERLNMKYSVTNYIILYPQTL